MLCYVTLSFCLMDLALHRGVVFSLWLSQLKEILGFAN